MSDHISRHSIVTERRLREAMEKLDKHHPQIAGRLRTIWRREDDAWARGEELPARAPEHEPEYELVEAATLYQPTIWDRLSGYWRR